MAAQLTQMNGFFALFERAEEVANGEGDVDHEQIGAAPGAQHGERLGDVRGVGDGRAPVHRELGRGAELAVERADDQKAHGLLLLPTAAG